MSIHDCQKRNAEAQLRRRQNSAYRIQEQVPNMKQRLFACTNHENRTQEQVANTKQRQTASTNPEDRSQEQVADTAWRQIARLSLGNRAQEQVANTNTARRQNACTNLENRAQEQVTNTAQRRLARKRPGVLENEALWWQEIMYQMVTKFYVSSGTYIHHQPCKVRNVECQHGCGYTHLSSSTRSTRKKCCVDRIVIP